MNRKPRNDNEARIASSSLLAALARFMRLWRVVVQSTKTFIQVTVASGAGREPGECKARELNCVCAPSTRADAPMRRGYSNLVVVHEFNQKGTNKASEQRRSRAYYKSLHVARQIAKLQTSEWSVKARRRVS